jgi:hypothetical protein
MVARGDSLQDWHRGSELETVKVVSHSSETNAGGHGHLAGLVGVTLRLAQCRLGRRVLDRSLE